MAAWEESMDRNIVSDRPQLRRTPAISTQATATGSAVGLLLLLGAWGGRLARSGLVIIVAEVT
jgi:hypothetical protein